MSQPPPEGEPPPAGSAAVFAFPPLPSPPEPPRFDRDPRQATVTRIVGGLGGQLGGEVTVRGPNLERGFRASAVDVGAIQQMLERSLARFDEAVLEDRWDDVRLWVQRVVLAWAQRVKELRVERLGGAFRVEIECQDDWGYYRYGFDVFPAGREAGGRMRQ